MNNWIYDIMNGSKCIAYSGDDTFSSKEEAIQDAKNYIDQELKTEYNLKNLEIMAYQAFC